MNIFLGKNGIPYSIIELDINKIIKNLEFLSNYSMKELHDLYMKYYGNYVTYYPIILKSKIELYDKSSEVNSFIYNEKPYWFDKNTRIGLMNLANCTDSNVLLLLGDLLVEIKSDKLKLFLKDLEVYASLCFVNTNKHLLTIKNLKTVEDIINYDYTSGYPDKLVLNG